jgi:hypothetical protein
VICRRLVGFTFFRIGLIARDRLGRGVAGRFLGGRLVGGPVCSAVGASAVGCSARRLVYGLLRGSAARGRARLGLRVGLSVRHERRNQAA